MMTKNKAGKQIKGHSIHKSSHKSPKRFTAMITPCDGCGAKCCRYFALEIDTPEDRADFEDLRWYISHENTVLYVEEGTWYLHINNDCRFRAADNRCTNYSSRPTMCREHSPKDCERFEPWSCDLKFTNLAELECYITAFFN
ncbi:MAG: YkgJ family cysteine cluster protein [Planctomycetes bacterium]|nr:YkgJ family cysteine cluster protein [Planctomycetota bacterium]